MMMDLIDSWDQQLVELAVESRLLPGWEHATEPNGKDLVDVVERVPDRTLLELVAGCRGLRDRLNRLELEAARQARAHGVTVRQLAAASGLSERRANDRYRVDRSGS